MNAFGVEKRGRQLNRPLHQNKNRGAFSLFDCHSSVPRRESTGRQYFEKLLRKAVVAADSTSLSHSRGPEGPVVCGKETNR